METSKKSQKSDQNRPKMDFLRGLEGFLGRPEASWAVLRRLWEPSWLQVRSERPLWGGLGSFLGRLGAKLRAKMIPNWLPRGRFLGSKNDVNNDPEESKKSTPLTHFRAPGRPLEHQKKNFERSGAAFNCEKKIFTEKMASRWILKRDENEDNDETDEKLMKNWGAKKACFLTAIKRA